jgi:hypothetical protein
MCGWHTAGQEAGTPRSNRSTRSACP